MTFQLCGTCTYTYVGRWQAASGCKVSTAIQVPETLTVSNGISDVRVYNIVSQVTVSNGLLLPFNKAYVQL